MGNSDDSVCRNDILADDDNFREYRTGKMAEVEEDGTWNQDYLEEAGEYFEDHFAFRQYFVTANALLKGNVFQTGATDQVIVGKDDWLYFGGTVNDW